MSCGFSIYSLVKGGFSGTAASTDWDGDDEAVFGFYGIVSSVILEISVLFKLLWFENVSLVSFEPT